jgi:endonuclease/exonuclease/phosphatase family metal-dependent hydrolase
MLRNLIFGAFCLMMFSLEAQPVKAITFNIRFANQGDGNNQWELRKAAVADFLKYESPDFVGMQEALIGQIEYLDAALPDHEWIGVGRDDGKEAGEFSPLFYNARQWELQSESTFWLSQTPDVPSKSWDAALPRICTYGVFRHKSTGETLYVFNTHYDHVGQQARKEASRIIVEKIKEVSNFENTILTGDFNAEADTEVITNITDAPLIDAYESTPTRYGPIGTFTGFNMTMNPNRRIDYIFHSEDLSADNYKVESTVIDQRYLSDHFPVVVTLNKK